MHDIRSIRENPDAFDAALAKRGAEPQSAEILKLDEARRALATELQQGLAKRNEASKAIGQAMAAKDMDKAEALKAEVAALKESLPALEEKEKEVGAELEALLAAIPNLPADDVPAGADEEANVEISRWGTPCAFEFEPQDHADFGPALGLDFEAAAAMSGARFAALRGGMARLHRALAQFMLDLHVNEHGYTECNVPLIVNDDSMRGTGQLPKFEEDLFSTMVGEHKRYLVPTAEVPLTNLVRDEIVEDAQLPLRLTAHSMCFRAEAGSYGRDVRGMIRQHQFEKVELVAVARPAESEQVHQDMVRHAETVLEKLGLPYRTMLLCTGDMGFGARKTYDLEVWLPGQNAYREISSVSNCGDFQARRMQARWRNPETGKPEPLHTLNGSGVAVGRALVAVLENYQNADGSITVPEALRPYMAGAEKIG